MSAMSTKFLKLFYNMDVFAANQNKGCLLKISVFVMLLKL